MQKGHNQQTGNRFYQLSLAGGMIDGSIEKQDGTANNLLIEVYRGGTDLPKLHCNPAGCGGYH